MTKLLTPEDVATQLQLNIRAVYRLVSDKKLKAIRIGRKIRVHAEDLEEFIRKCGVGNI